MKQSLYQLAGDFRKTYQKKFNNTYIWSSIAIEAIRASAIDDDFLEQKRFKVPSKNPSKRKKISRTKEELSEILSSAAEIDFNYAIFSYIVTQVEAFFADLVFGVLKIDKRRLKTRIQGIDHVERIDVSDALDSDSIEELIHTIIRKELIGIFYSSPEKQFVYLEKVLGVDFDERLKKLSLKWKEYKAARDIIIHNSGIINDAYISKSGEFCRWAIGDQIQIDDRYLNALVAEAKALVGKICSSIQRKNKA